MKKQSKMMIGITAGVLLVAVIIIAAVIMASGSDSKRYARHMEAAQRYMDELDYEQAIAEYRAAIEIEPNNVEAYQALAELYVQMGDYESAIEVLNQGIEQTGAEELHEGIEMKYHADGSHWFWEYDTNGSYRITRYQGDGTIDLVEEYDENGNLVKSTDYIYNADGTIDFYVIHEYDGNGNRVKTTLYNADGTLDSYLINEYDGNGNLVKGTLYNADGTLDSYLIDEYDGNGNLVKGTLYNADGTLDSYLINEYDGNGNRVKCTWYNADGTIDRIYEYDGNGNAVKNTYYNADGSYR